jgi:hypothetical protein
MKGFSIADFRFPIGDSRNVSDGTPLEDAAIK